MRKAMRPVSVTLPLQDLGIIQKNGGSWGNLLPSKLHTGETARPLCSLVSLIARSPLLAFTRGLVLGALQFGE